MLVATVDGPVTPFVADHLVAGIKRVEREGWAALAVQLDTPGGLDHARRDIVAAVVAAPVPVLVHVAPSGARALSAGATIAFAAHVVAMAPGTTIGGAAPVTIEGGDARRRIVEEAAAYAEFLARLRGRDPGFPGDAVRYGRTVTASGAVEVGAVDFLAESLTEVLDRADGMAVRVAGGGPVTLALAGARFVRHEMGPAATVAQHLADPDVAFALFAVAMLALASGVARPGLRPGVVVAGLFAVPAGFSLSVLPVSLLGVVFLAVSGLLFMAAVLAPGAGLWAAGGAVTLAAADRALFQGSPGFSVNPGVVVTASGVTGVAVYLVGRRARERRHRRRPPELEALQGRLVVVRSASGDRGQGRVAGAWWSLRSTGPPLKVGSAVRVRDVDGLDLVVEPAARHDAGP